MRLKPKYCIYVSGVGYDQSFKRLIETQVKDAEVFLLTLNDIFSKSNQYHSAVNVLPDNICEDIDWSRFKV